MSTHRKGKTLIITDEEEEEEEEAAEDLNPFSFKQFLRWKNQDQDQDQDQDQNQDQNQDQDQTHSEEQREEAWGRGLECTADCSSAPLSEETTRFCSDPERGGGACEGEGAESSSPRRGSHLQQLEQENRALRRNMEELQRRSEAQELRAEQLWAELQQRKHQEQKEAQDLEDMVHSVEQNLHLMTKRAVRAESCVCKLKAELQQLQVEAESLRSQNEELRAAESLVVMTMKQKAQTASESLNKAARHAHCSITQLLGEVDTLRLVSHLLRSIDKISEP